MLVIPNRPRASRSSDFEVTRLISPWIVLHSVQLPLLIIIIIIIENNNNFICQKFKLYNNYLQDKRLKERLNIYMIIASIISVNFTINGNSDERNDLYKMS